jgi:hypothetical protein
MAADEKSHILNSIRELKDLEPFAPFAILVSSGNRYVIEAPANLVEMKSEFFYAYPGGEKWVLIRMNQIVAVETPGEKRRSSRRRAS